MLAKRLRQHGHLVVCEEDLHALLCLDSQLSPGGKDSWHGAKVEPVHKARCETP